MTVDYINKQIEKTHKNGVNYCKEKCILHSNYTRHKKGLVSRFDALKEDLEFIGIELKTNTMSND